MLLLIKSKRKVLFVGRSQPPVSNILLLPTFKILIGDLICYFLYMYLMDIFEVILFLEIEYCNLNNYKDNEERKEHILFLH